MKENSSELKNGLGIDEWLELIKEDKNLNGAYISIAQYIYLIEKENQETKELLHKIMTSGVDEKSTPVLDLYKENQKLREKIKVYEDPEDLTLMFMYCNEKAKDKIKELEEQLEERPKEYVFIGNAQNKTRDFINQNVKENKVLNKKLEDLLTQQKEFINWLEDYIKLFDKKDIYEEGSCDTIEEILNKYKSIIGCDKDE